jgi:NUMOD4 motif/HNH endonuclease
VTSTEPPTEVWKQIPGYARYDASNLGRIRSWAKPGPHPDSRRATPKLMTPHTRPDGYQQVKLSAGGTSTTMKLHRLVLLTFIGEPLPGYAGSHIDNDPSNNRLTNLAWEPHLWNMQRQSPHGSATRNKVRGERHHSTPLTENDVRAIRAAYAKRGKPKIDPVNHPTALAKRYGVSREAIKAILARRTWKHVASGD